MFEPVLLYIRDPRELRTKFSPRELQCSQLRCQGMTLGEIAEDLGIDYSTVKNHITAALKRVGAHSMDTICYNLGRLDERQFLIDKAGEKSE